MPPTVSMVDSPLHMGHVWLGEGVRVYEEGMTFLYYQMQFSSIWDMYAFKSLSFAIAVIETAGVGWAVLLSAGCRAAIVVTTLLVPAFIAPIIKIINSSTGYLVGSDCYYWPSEHPEHGMFSSSVKHFQQ